MTRIVLAGLACLILASCGGGAGRMERNYGGQSRVIATPRATTSGPIYQACLNGGRTAANPRLCGCIQAMANVSLSGSDQSMAAKFFADPHHAQEIRQSDNPAHEAFWKRYKAFTGQAEQACQGL
jgi:hypothetical protein